MRANIIPALRRGVYTRKEQRTAHIPTGTLVGLQLHQAGCDSADQDSKSVEPFIHDKSRTPPAELVLRLDEVTQHLCRCHRAGKKGFADPPSSFHFTHGLAASTHASDKHTACVNTKEQDMENRGAIIFSTRDLVGWRKGRKAG